MKSKYSSYYINDIAKGCKYCVKGEKLVLFISGKCSRNCYYCSLSNKRKNKDVVWLNERICKNPKDAIKEALESNATSAGITGGDPFLYLERTLSYAKALKKRFGKNFHIHIYLPTKLLTKDKLKKLSRYIDEIRFHPEFLINKNKKIINEDLNKIKLASLFWKKQNIGIELPMIPDRKKDILDFIIKISHYMGFANFNEFELSETNCKPLTKNYILNEGGYTIKGSKQAGIWLLKELKKRKIKINLHLCTAELKNNYQFMNRLKRHNIFKFGYKTKEGMVKYLTTDIKNKYKLNKLKIKEYYIDKEKNRIILSNYSANRLLSNKNSKIKIYLIEEFPTYDRIETEKGEIKTSKKQWATTP
ncbi:MAG: 4Fe-4S cluster-binding domain-containing protein [Nanoarchaeota archaeon]|nr:4Fe-4S cluster-binding domain-containing protein [Nanoarchaeota archaeon]